MLLPILAHRYSACLGVDWRPEVRMEIDKFLLEGKVDELPRLCAELLEASVKLDLPGLKNLCVKSIIDNLSPENVMDSLILVDQYGFDEITAYIQNYIITHFRQIVETMGQQYYVIES